MAALVFQVHLELMEQRELLELLAVVEIQVLRVYLGLVERPELVVEAEVHLHPVEMVAVEEVVAKSKQKVLIRFTSERKKLVFLHEPRTCYHPISVHNNFRRLNAITPDVPYHRLPLSETFLAYC
jgi:hypothetical protein